MKKYFLYFYHLLDWINAKKSLETGLTSPTHLQMNYQVVITVHIFPGHFDWNKLLRSQLVPFCSDNIYRKTCIDLIASNDRAQGASVILIFFARKATRKSTTKYLKNKIFRYHLRDFFWAGAWLRSNY